MDKHCSYGGSPTGHDVDRDKRERLGLRQLSVFKVPRNMLQRWSEAIGRCLSLSDFVCELHFSKDSINKEDHIRLSDRTLEIIPCIRPSLVAGAVPITDDNQVTTHNKEVLDLEDQPTAFVDQLLESSSETSSIYSESVDGVRDSSVGFPSDMDVSSPDSVALDDHESRPRGKSDDIEATADDLLLSKLDLTGSPLEVNLDVDHYDESVIEQQNWLKEEECHFPLTISEARVALNCCLEHLNQKMWTMPVISVCDGKDHDRTVLLGTYAENEWYTTMQARVLESVCIKTVVNTPSRLMEEYARIFSVQEREVTVSAHSTYQLCGERQVPTDLIQSVGDRHNSILNLEVNWNSPTFYAPIKASTSKLIMVTAGGWNNSYLKNMWEELTSLHEFLTILTERKTEYLESFTSFRSMKSYKKMSREEIDGQLISLVNCENKRGNLYRSEDDVYTEDTEEVTLQKHLENAKLRPNKDFTEYLWELLISCSDYVQVKETICSLLQKMRTGCIDPQILTTRSTRITQILSKIVSDNIELLNELLPLEFLVDIGFQKLTRDYSYILSSSNFLDCYEFQQHFCDIQAGSFDIKNYREKLTSLGGIHMCLEFVLLAQTQINCSTANLKPVFTSAFRQYSSERSVIKSFSELLGYSVQCLEVAIPSVTVHKIIQGLPSMWYLTLSSESKNLKVTTTSHLGRNPIMPPNIYDFDELGKPGTYHLIQLTSRSMKIA